MNSICFSLDTFKDCERFANLIAVLQSAAVDFQVSRSDGDRYVYVSFERK